MNREAILERFAQDLHRSSVHTRKQRVKWADSFLAFAEEKEAMEPERWNRTLVDDFSGFLEREGYARGTERLVLSIVKRVFDAAKEVHETERVQTLAAIDPLDPGATAKALKAISKPAPSWDVGKRWMPRVSAEDVERPALTLGEAERMINAAREGILPADEAAFLALATTLGLRRGELGRVHPGSLRLEESMMYVDTEKGGEARWQLLPKEIIPFLAGHGFSQVYAITELSRMYWRICARAGVEGKDGGGWHSIRRFLDTELRDACGELLTKSWLRWKMSAEMVDLYYSRDPLELDRKVLEVHPVLPLWAGESVARKK